MSATPEAVGTITPAPFASLAALQAAHEELLAACDTDGEYGRIAEFVERAVQSGAVLKLREDRSAAQDLINFWVSRWEAIPETPCPSDNRQPSGLEAAAVETANSPSRLPFHKTLLKKFDPVTTITVAFALSEWWKTQSDSETRLIVNRIMLRLVRLKPDGQNFESAPALRLALYDVSTPEKVDAVLNDLSRIGAIQISRGTTPDLDTVRLSIPELMDEWQKYREWLQRRRAFRTAAEAWKAAGRKGTLIRDDFQLDQARQYHDRSEVERRFLGACIDRERYFRDMLQAAIVVMMVVAGAVGLLWWQSNLSNNELTKVNDKLNIANRKLEERSAELERQAELTAMVQMVRTLAELGAARTEAELEVISDRWESLVKPKPAILRPPAFSAAKSGDSTGTPDQPIIVQLGRSAEQFQFPGGLKNDVRKEYSLACEEAIWKNVLWYRTDAWREFNKRALKVAYKFRNQLLAKDDPEVIRGLEVIRSIAFARVTKCTAGMLEKFRNGSFDDGEAFVREFWLNYWGELGMLENDKVKTAMVAFGNHLRDVEEGFPHGGVIERTVAYSRMITPDQLKKFEALQGNLLVAFENEMKEPIRTVDP